MITSVPGVAVGHWTDPRARTGCTVVLMPEGTVASGEIRGGAPATREWALLDPLKTVDRLDAVMLSGGSAFGLAAGDGAMRWLEERGRGFPTPAGPVPIVVGMSLFDLRVGDGSVRPDAAAGYDACSAASSGGVEVGAVGAGTGATVGKWRGWDDARPGGVCGAVRRHGDLVVATLVVANALGDVDRGEAPGLEPDDLVGAGWLPPVQGGSRDATGTESVFGNTTIGVVATNARLRKGECHLVAQSAHDGLARSLLPAHTRSDGDGIVAAATGEVHADLGAVRQLAVTVVAAAVRSLGG
jgi:L-aminopeptidase/D-esterase-like protein